MAIVKPVANALLILEYLSKSGEPGTVTEIARGLKINPSTCFNILRTLVAGDVLNFNERSKAYSMSLGVVRLAQRTLSENGKLAAILPLLQKLADQYHVTVTMWRLYRDDRIMMVAITQAAADVQIQMRIGQRLPRFIGAFGRVLAARSGCSKTAIRREFRKLRWADPPEFEDYWADVEKVGDRGWAKDDGNFVQGVTSLCVPIANSDGAIIYGLSVTMIRGQHKASALGDILAEMMQIKAKIEALY